MPRTKKPRAERRVLLAVYLPRDVLERLRQKAEKDRRSASSQALVLIEKGLDQAPG